MKVLSTVALLGLAALAQATDIPVLSTGGELAAAEAVDCDLEVLMEDHWNGIGGNKPKINFACHPTGETKSSHYFEVDLPDSVLADHKKGDLIGAKLRIKNTEALRTHGKLSEEDVTYLANGPHPHAAADARTSRRSLLQASDTDTRSLIVILLEGSANGTPLTAPRTAAEQEAIFWGPGGLVEEFENITHHRYTFSNGGAHKIAITMDMSGCDSVEWAEEAEAILLANTGINAQDFQHRAYMIPEGNGCTWPGVGTLGTVDSTRSLYVGLNILGGMDNTIREDTWNHEMGHNLGLHHAAQGDEEYGDMSSRMGSADGQQKGWNAAHTYHLDAMRDQVEDWTLDASDWGTSRTFTLTAPHLWVAGAGKTHVLRVNDRYMMWSMKAGYNHELPDPWANKVNIIKWDGETTWTWNEARLDVGESYDNLDRPAVEYTVTFVSKSADNTEITVRVDCGSFWPTDAPTGVPTTAPTREPTDLPMQTFTVQDCLHSQLDGAYNRVQNWVQSIPGYDFTSQPVFLHEGGSYSIFFLTRLFQQWDGAENTKRLKGAYWLYNAGTYTNGYYLTEDVECVDGQWGSTGAACGTTNDEYFMPWDVEWLKDGQTAMTLIPPANPTTDAPTVDPTGTPTGTPTNAPTNAPTGTPTNAPTLDPTDTPTVDATPLEATVAPTSTPTVTPTGTPTVAPTGTPTVAPTGTPTADVGKGPDDEEPPAAPTAATNAPTSTPTVAPTGTPTVATTPPTPEPTNSPTVDVDWFYKGDSVYKQYGGGSYLNVAGSRGKFAVVTEVPDDATLVTGEFTTTDGGWEQIHGGLKFSYGAGLHGFHELMGACACN